MSQTRPIIDGELGNYTSVTLHQGRTTAILSIPIIDDQTYQKNAYIRVSLDDGSGYRQNESALNAEVYVEDNDLLNEVTIQSVNNIIAEGETAEFLITTQPTNLDRLIDVTETKTGDFFTDLELPPAILVADESKLFIRIPTLDDEQDEPDGTIELVLNSGANYTVASGESRANVTIEDDDYGPDISITSNAGSIAEDETAQFIITSSHLSLSDIELTLQLTDPQGFTGRTSHVLSATIAAGELTTMLDVPMVDNQNGDQDGTIEVALLSSSSYFINPEQSSASILVLDNDLPRLSVSPTLYIYEDEEAIFGLNSTVAVPRELMINFHVAVEGNYWSNFIGDFQAGFYDNQIEGTPTNQYLPVQIGYNSAMQDDGSVTLTIKPGLGYNVANAPANHATTEILDAQTPEVSIYRVFDNIVEGDQAIFYLSMRTSPSNPLPINFEVTSTGNFLTGVIPSSISIPIGETGKLLTLDTINDAEFEQRSDITVRVIDGAGYRPHLRFASSSVTLRDDDGPEITITADSAEIFEDETASFTITASKSVNADLTIPIEITQTGDFLVDSEFEPALLPADTTSIQYQIGIVDDETFELDGTINAKLISGENYSIPTYPNNIATVTVMDNDTPTGISVLAMMESIQEGETAQFQLFSPTELTENITVNVDIANVGSYLTSSNLQQVIMEHGENSTVFDIYTVNDSLDEANGSVSVTIQSGTGYEVSTTQSSASINILDNEVPPVISIRGGDNIEEGNDAEFIITASHLADNAREVLVTLSETGNFITGGTEGDQATRTITLPAKQLETSLFVQTDANSDPEADGQLTATLIPPTVEGEYQIASSPDNSASVIILDDDLPRISINYVGSNEIDEGDIAFIDLSWTHSIPPLTPIPMHAEIAGDFFESDVRSGDFNLVASPANSLSEIVRTVDDSTPELDGSVTWVIRSSTDYNIDLENSSTTVHIRDNDLPRISIIANSEAVTEGAEVEFIISAESPVANDLLVNLNLDVEGEYEIESITNTVTISAGESSTSLTLAINDDDQIEPNGIIIATVEPSANYNLAASSHSALVNLIDSEQLRVSVASISELVVEGDNVEFRISTDQILTQDLEVNFNFSVQGEFLVDELPESIMVFTGRSEVLLTIPTQDDTDYERDGVLTLTTETSQNYNVALLASSTQVTIQDNDGPIITVAGVSSIAEGDDANFVISASEPPSNDLEINVEIIAIGNFIGANSQSTVQISADSSAGSLQISTIDDTVDENDGEITVSILPGSGYQVADGLASSMTTAITDDEPDSVVSLVSEFPAIIEGDRVGFEITATTASQVPRFIPVEISDPNQKFFRETLRTSFHINATERRAYLSVPTIDNNTFEFNEGITAEILRGEGYTVADYPGNTTTVAVLDDDTPRGISIIALNETIAEGDIARFQIAAQNAEPVDREIVIQVSDEGGYIDGSSPTTVTLHAASISDFLEFSTQHDNIDQPSGEITVTIEPGVDYVVATEPYHTATVLVQDLEQPTLTIASELEVLEGDTTQFTITASQVSADPLYINLAITETGEFLDVAPNPIAILAAGNIETSYSISILDNEQDSADGLLKVKLLEGLNYRIDSNNSNEATINILDNDPPELALVALDTSIVEGQMARFELRSTSSLATDLPVIITVIPENGDFVGEPNLTRTEIITAGDTWMRFTVATDDDQIYEFDGSFAVQIEPDPQYSVAENLGVAQVQVGDNDPPVISVSTQPIYEEGDTVQFSFSATPVPLEALTVDFHVSQIGNYIADLVSNQLEFKANSDIEILTIKTLENTIDESDGSIALTLLADENYHLDKTAFQATTTITDNDYNIVSVHAESESVMEGTDQFISVEIAIDPPIPDKAVVVNLEYFAQGDYFTRDTFTDTDRISFSPEWQKTVSVVIPAGSRQITQQIAIQDDTEFEPYGQLFIQLHPGADYTVSALGNRTATQILDDDAPVGISVYPVGGDEFLESETAVLEIRSDTVVSQSTEIYLEVVETGQMIAGEVPIKVVIPTGQDSTRLEIPLEDDNISEIESEILLKILPNPNYTVTTEFFEAYVVVIDNDQPIIAINGLGAINEGSDAQFEITVTPAPQESLSIDFSLTEEGDFLISHPAQTVDLDAFQDSIIVSAQTQNDHEFELDGAIIATLTETYEYRISATAGQARVIVKDDETPTGFSILSTTDSIQEGDIAVFQIRTDSPSISAREVAVELSDNSKNLVESYPEFVTILPGETAATLSLQAIDDLIYHTNQHIVVQLKERSEYDLVDAYSQATVSLIENDLPEVTISTLSETSIREGELAEFIISTPNPLPQDLAVMINSVIPDNLTSDDIPSTITIPAGEISNNIQIQTDLDQILETDREISIELVADSNYLRGVAKDHASVQVTDSNISTVTIESSVNEIVEGSELEFIVQITPAFTLDEAEVRVKHEFRNDDQVQVEWKTLTINEGMTERRYTVTLPDNFQREVDKSITATIMPSLPSTEAAILYRLEEDSNHAIVKILDNDSPSGISIIPIADAVIEGEVANFQLRANTPLAENQTVQLRVFGSNELIDHPQYFDWEFNANQRQTNISISTLDDEVFRPNGIMTVQILPNQEYLVARTNSSTTIKIVDNDFLPGIAIIAEKSVITEGDDLNFLIRAGEISVNDRTLGLQIQQVGEFISENTLSAMTIPAGSQEQTIRIPTIDDRIFEIGGAVTVSLDTNSEYEISSERSSATTRIEDNDTPQGISILPVTEKVIEGDSAQFQITTANPAVFSIDVNVLITGTGDFFANQDGIQTVTIPAQEGHAQLNIATIDNAIYQLDGLVTAEIKPGSLYAIAERGNQAKVIVQDNDLPIISISGITDIVEGEEISFQLEAATVPLQDLAIALAINQTGDYLAESAPDQVVVPAGHNLITKQLLTVNDSIDELDGEIVITLQSGTGYRVAEAPNNEIRATISDNDLNSISLNATSPTVMEGDTASFEVISSLPVTSSFPVNITFSQIGQFIDNFIDNQTVTFAVGEEIKLIEFALADDEVLEDSGRLTGQITAGDDYEIALSPNDSAIIELLDDDTPILAITGSTPIEEGDTAEFIITSTETALTPIQVQISEHITGVQVGNNAPTSLEIATGEDSTSIVIPTIDDDEFAPDGQITIRLLESNDFVVHEEQSDATITVENNDFPELAIVSTGDIIEGTDTHAEFTITATFAPIDDLSINLNFSQVGNFVAGDLLDNINLLANETSVNVLVPIRNDDIEQADGQITGAIQPGTGYQINPVQQTASVQIENDDTYLVSLNANATKILEGDTIEYSVTVSPPAPQFGITVQVNHVGVGSFITDFEEILEFEAGESQKSYSLPTRGDNLYTADGKVTATITAADSFSIQPGEGQIITKIADNDAPGGISVIPISASINEGELAEFQITANQATNREREVFIAISESGHDITNQFNIPDFVTIEAGQRATMLTVETEADDLIENNGLITLTILAGEEYVVANSNASASVTVINEDDVTLSISAVQSQITEGLPVKLSILSSPVAPLQELVLHFEHEVEGEFLQSDPLTENIIFPSDFNGQLAQLDIAQTLNDIEFEANGQLTIELVSGENYNVAGAPNNSTSVMLVDNDEPYGISITPPLTSVTEGSNINFQITASTIEPTDRIINLSVSELNSSYVSEFIDQIILPANAKSVQLAIATEDNLINDLNGDIIVSIEDGTGYEIADDFNIAFATVINNDEPLITINAGDAIEENELAEFTIQSSNISALDVLILIDYALVGDFADTESFPAIVTLPAGETETVVRIPMIDDNDHEQDGQLTAILIAGSDYLIDDSEYTATVPVQDNDLPTISITKLTDITEGEVAEFRISADDVPNFDLTINLLSEWFGNERIAQPTNNFEVTLASGERTKSIAIPTNNDNQSNADYELELTIGTGSGYRIDNDTSHDRLVVYDDDYYTIGLTIDTPTVIEGEEIHYSVTTEANALVRDELIIYFELESSDEFGNESSTFTYFSRLDPNVVTFSNSLPTGRNFEKDGHFQYFVRLLPGDGYRVDPTATVGSVQILDADSPVGFSIEAINRFSSIDGTTITTSNLTDNEYATVEGQPAYFAIRSDKILTVEQEIIVDITETGDFLSNSSPKRILFPVGQYSVSFEIPTSEDHLIEVDGTISASIRPSESFQVAESPHNTATVAVYDNDQELPGIMVLAQTNLVVEGQPAQFFIKSSSTFDRDQNISLSVTGAGDFITNHISDTAILPSGKSSVIYSIPTIDDNNFETNRKVSVLIDDPNETGANYQVISEPFNSASVDVLDNDPPLGIAILSAAEAVTEGESAWFQITSTPPLAENKSITVQIEQVGDFMAETTLQLSVTIASLNSITLFDLSTIDDELYEADGVVSVTIQSSRDYVVAPEYQSASVLILDNDLPEVSISGIGPAIEGEHAEFTLSSTLAPFNNLEVNLAISQIGAFIADDVTERAILQANTTSIPVLIPTLDDNEDEIHGTIEVEILPGTGYSVATEPDNSAKISIEDNDRPVISITADDSSVNEGDPAVFRLESTTPPDNVIPITISLSQIGEYFDESAITITPDLSADQTFGLSNLSTILYNFDSIN